MTSKWIYICIIYMLVYKTSKDLKLYKAFNFTNCFQGYLYLVQLKLKIEIIVYKKFAVQPPLLSSVARCKLTRLETEIPNY